jgi:hypothetical protein
MQAKVNEKKSLRLLDYERTMRVENRSANTLAREAQFYFSYFSHLFTLFSPRLVERYRRRYLVPFASHRSKTHP